MKAIVVYDSLYGNTEQVARIVGAALKEQGAVDVKRVGEVRSDELDGLSLVVIGSPTQQFRPTQAMRDFLDSIAKGRLVGVKVAAFDTRLTWAEIEKSPPLPFFVRIYGYAARRIAKKLQQKGGMLVAKPEGFFVEGMKGPLSEGELQRAEVWAKKLLA